VEEALEVAHLEVAEQEAVGSILNENTNMEIIENQESLASHAEKEFKELKKEIDLTRIYKDVNGNYLFMIEVFHTDESSFAKFIMVDQYGTVEIYNDYQVKPADINPIPQFLSLLRKKGI